MSLTLYEVMQWINGSIEQKRKHTWAYLESAILSFSHWDDAAHLCIPIFAATICQPRAWKQQCLNNFQYIDIEGNMPKQMLLLNQLQSELKLPGIDSHVHCKGWSNKGNHPKHVCQT